MNVVIRFAIAAIALGMFFVPVQPAAAQCYGSACGAVLVPAPNPIPLRKLKGSCLRPRRCRRPADRAASTR